MSADTRFRLIAAAERGLAWRRERIMEWRVLLVAMLTAWGHPCDWHSLFECRRHGHHPLDAKWVGPYNLGTED